ncbi:MAG: sugar phosphate isomerase/epimerase [Phycisphaerae bacterium]|nr:sugar phosphate isomerase/epimerase [Phycisphaerae bacterium]
MRIGLLTNGKTHDVKFLADHGFGSLELIAWPGEPFDPKKVTARQIDEFKQQLVEYNIELSAVGYYPNHICPKEGKIAKPHFIAMMKLGRKLGCDVIGTFTGRNPEKSIDDNIPGVKKYWTEMAKRAADLGMKVAFENCPMFHHHPFRGTNIAFTPGAWQKIFDAVPSDALGLEWDPSHLICLLIDPVPTIKQFADKIFHVHAKDAEVCWDVVKAQGIWDTKAVRHRMPGLGQVNWREVVSALLEVGYKGNLDIEGAHDPVYGGNLEDAGLLISLNALKQYVPVTM